MHLKRYETKEHTYYLRIRPILPSTDIHKIKHGLATRKTARKVLNQVRDDDDATTHTNVRQTPQIRIHADDDLHVLGTLRDLGNSPFGHRSVEESGGLLATDLALLEEILVEDHAVAVD